MRWWPRRARRAARAVGGRGRELDRDVSRRSVPRCRALRLLVDTGHVADWGGDPLRAARARRPRAAPPGQARVDAGARRRPEPASSTSPRCSRRLDAARLPRASSASSTSTSPSTAGRSPTPSAWARDLAARAPAARDAYRLHVSRWSGGAGPGRAAAGRGWAVPSNATTLPGMRVGRRTGCAGRRRRSSSSWSRPRPRSRGSRAIAARRVDDADAVLDGRRDVEAAVGVEAEAVAAARARASRSPTRARRRVAARCSPRRSTTTTSPSGSRRDAVAVLEAVGERAHRAVALVRPHPPDRLVGWRDSAAGR